MNLYLVARFAVSLALVLFFVYLIAFHKKRKCYFLVPVFLFLNIFSAFFTGNEVTSFFTSLACLLVAAILSFTKFSKIVFKVLYAVTMSVPLGILVYKYLVYTGEFDLVISLSIAAFNIALIVFGLTYKGKNIVSKKDLQNSPALALQDLKSRFEKGEIGEDEYISKRTQIIKNI